MTANFPVKSAFTVAVVGATCVVGLWLWHCWCVFPYHSWNELRLIPSFTWAQGHPVYTSEQGGPASTWIYGPVPVLMLWPATLASSAAAALLTAGFLNLLVTVSAVFVFCLSVPATPSTTRWHRYAAALVCLALWPRSAFQYIQADNFTIAFGLIGNLLLLRGGRGACWLAAACAVTAMACKQTSLELPAAQLLWLGIVAGRRAMFTHLLRLAVCALLLGSGVILTFDPQSLWFNLVTLPGGLPWKGMLERIYEDPTSLALHVVLPGLILMTGRKKIFCRESPLLLPALCCLLSFAPGLASFFKIGGSSNSFHGMQYFLPALLIWAASRWGTNSRFNKAPAFVILLVVLCPIGRLGLLPVRVWTPLTIHLHQAAFLSHELPGQVWFPWNPVITYYAEKKVYHTEDGLAIRHLAGKSLDILSLTQHLPPQWHVTAVRSNQAEWGIAETLRPLEVQTTTVGLWRIESWNLPPPSRLGDPAPPDSP